MATRSIETIGTTSQDTLPLSATPSGHAIPGYDLGCVVRDGKVYLPCGREALVRRWRMGRRYEKEGERYVLLPRKGVLVPARLTQVIALATVPNPERRPRAERTASGEIVWKGARPRKPKPRQKHKFVYRMDTAAELRFRGV